MKNTLFITLAAMIGALPVFGQLPDEKGSDSRMVLTKTSTDAQLTELIKKDRPKGPNEIPTPKFAIHTKDNKFVLSIGGKINPIIGVDLGNDLYEVDGAGVNFVTNSIPVPAMKGKRSDFFINALNASVDMQIVGLGGTPDQITGYLKIGTDGISKGVRLKKAYVSWRGFTAGMKTTIFQDDDACQPPTIDPQGPSGIVGGTMYEFSYTSPSFSGFRVAAALDMPSYCASNGLYRGHDFRPWGGRNPGEAIVCNPEYYNQMVPDVPVWVEYAYSDMNRIRVSAILRNFIYQDVLAGKKRHEAGWGVMLSGNLNPVKPLILYGQIAYGKGIGNYIQDLQGIPLSFTPSESDPGRMSPNPMMGWVFGATYNISPRWQVNGMVSQARIWNAGAYALAASDGESHLNDYHYGMYAACNVFYNISSYFQVGLEYVWGHRQTYGHGGADNSRIQTQFQFTF